VRPEDLATCIACGLCLNDCPTYRVLEDEADSPRGRIQLIRTLVATEAAPDESLVGHLDACLVCRACETACPSGVPFGRIMEGAREVLHERRREGFVRRTSSVASVRARSPGRRRSRRSARVGRTSLSSGRTPTCPSSPGA
jgi:glycolate oxidase iron-sulfur subunit